MPTQDDLSDVGMRLYLSVDIEGSTKFKDSLPSIKIDARESEDADGHQEPSHNSWVTVYKEFFNDFPNIFTKLLGQSATQEKHSTDGLAEQLKLWKMLGDELVFVIPILTEADAGCTISAFEEAIDNHQSEIRQKHPELRLKGTAWTAGFPIRNRRVVVDQPNGDSVEDFLGPDMDIGFRLGKLARPGPIVASMDLVDILIGRHYQSNFHCAFVGWKTMKGVFADKPYPVHWLVHKDKGLSLPPWERSVCSLASGYIEWDNSGEGIEGVKERISLTRSALNEEEGLDLFSPYLDESDMPESHVKIHEWLTTNERSELSSVADFGSDDPHIHASHDEPPAD